MYSIVNSIFSYRINYLIYNRLMEFKMKLKKTKIKLLVTQHKQFSTFFFFFLIFNGDKHIFAPNKSQSNYHQHEDKYSKIDNFSTFFM